MIEKRKGNRVIHEPSEAEGLKNQQMMEEEARGMEANKQRGREILQERREGSGILATVQELKEKREELGITLSELAKKTGMTPSNLSRLENMQEPNPTVETLNKYATGIGHRLHISIVANS